MKSASRADCRQPSLARTFESGDAAAPPRGVKAIEFDSHAIAAPAFLLAAEASAALCRMPALFDSC